MKRSLIAMAAVLAAGTAFAQSSVQVYGRVNTSVERQKVSGTDAEYVMQNNSSRWGIRGTEDLGGGLKGLFLLESGFGSDDGALTQAGAIFGRESWVGVEGNFGRVRLGNMGATAAYYATADYISMHNHDTGTSSDALYLFPGFKQNTISYNTPSFGGLVVETQFGLKEGGAKNTAQIVANYDRGPLHLGASYLQGPTTVDGTTFNGGKEYGLRALYELGPVTVGAYFIRNNLDDSTDGTPDAKRNAYRLAAMYTFGGSEIHANVGYADKFKVGGTKIDDSDAMQYTVAYNYNLSKRTKVYAFYSKVNNKVNSGYFTGTDNADFSSVAVGVRHNF